MSLREVPPPLTRRGIPLEHDLRVLALGSFANRFGAGAVMTTSALYFTRQVGFSAAEVALAFSVAAIVGIVVQVPAGHLGDTRGPTPGPDALHDRRGPHQRPSRARPYAVAAGVAARPAGPLRALGRRGAAGRRRPARHRRARRAVQGLPARGDQHRDRPRLGVRRRRARHRREVGLRLGLRAQRRLHRLRRLEQPAPARPAALPPRRGRAPPRGAAGLALRRHRGHHGPVLAALLRDGARAGALHLRAHLGPSCHGRDPAHHQHGLRRGLPGPALPTCRLGGGGCPRAGARRGLDRGRLRDRVAGRPRRRDVRRRRCWSSARWSTSWAR